MGLVLDLARANNILIEDLAFRSSGVENAGPEDAILFDGTNSSENTTNKVRITHCSFDGYFDIAVEIRSKKSRLLATIDHCFFFDSNPGKPDDRGDLTLRENFFPFANRGAINIAAISGSDGNSFVTVANNVFADVWRRTPRVAFADNFGHVFNNLLFRWGFGNNDTDGRRGTDTWNGMAVGQGGKALIQANRFIPWVRKTDRTIKIDDPSTRVDIGLRNPPADPDLTNRFDNSSGTADAAIGPPRPGQGFANLDVATIYGSAVPPPLPALSAPPVTPKSGVDWVALVNAAGPRLPAAARDPETKEAKSRSDVLAFLQAAGG